MINVVVYGKDSADELGNLLIGVLAHYGGVQYYCKGVLSSFSQETPRFNLYFTSEILNIGLKSGIFILSSCKDDDLPVSIPEKMACIVDSSNTQALGMLQKSGHVAYCCGTSPRDTFSISSFETESAVVSLLRQVETIEEESIEPCDIPITIHSSVEPFSLLACCALLTISGEDINKGLVV